MNFYELINKEPDELLEIKTLPDGAKFIPIETLEGVLDMLCNWSTQNFTYYMFRDGYSNPCISASIEVLIQYDDAGEKITRTFVGACNFSLKSIYPNKHFLATAKSECVKNACSDIGYRLGRGLNRNLVPSSENEKEADEGVAFYGNINDIKTKEDVT
jgi:hypothetical protein